MQLATNINTVETGTVIHSGNFGVASNAKMFKVLSDSMYKDKIGSMVRELSSNARDAHFDAGKPLEPFVIHLPNAFEPWFSVTDTGTGISAKDIYKVLCIYGVSTKDQSNEAIGAFGLGAKTPFAYTDNFTVISRFEGIERMYSACFGADGMPTLDLQVENETGEPDGFSIMVSVNEGDFHRFQQKTKEQLRFFPTLPEIQNCKDFEWFNMTKDVLYTSDLITMYGLNYGVPISGLWITQGGIGYPVDIDELADIDKPTREFAEALKNKNSALHFDIGDIDVTAPRESVSYDKRTIQNIIDRVGEVAKVMCRDALKDIQAEKSIWNRAVLFNNHITVVQKAIKQSPLYDNLFEGMSMNNHGMLAVNVDDLLALNMKATNFAKYSSYRTKMTSIKKKVIGNYARYGNEYLTPAAEINVFIRDTNSKPMARVRHFIFENGFPLTIVIDSLDGLVLESQRQAIADSLRMPVSNVKLLSDLEAPKHVSGGGGDRNYTAPKSYLWSRNKPTSCSRDWDRLYDSLDDHGEAIWVEMDRHNIGWGADSSLVFTAKEAGQLDYDIIAVNGRTAQRIRDGKIGAELISVHVAAKDLRVKIKESEAMFVKYARDCGFLETLTRNSVVYTLLANGMFPDLAKRVTGMRAKKATVSRVLDNKAWMRRHLETIHPAAAKGEIQGQKIVDEIMSQFPMLKYMPSRYGAVYEDGELADLLAYVGEINKVVVDTTA